MVGTSLAQEFDINHVVATGDVRKTGTSLGTWDVYQADALRVSLWSVGASGAVDLSDTNLVRMFFVRSATNNALYIAVEGTTPDPTNGLSEFYAAPSNTVLTPGDYIGRVAACVRIGGTNYDRATLARFDFQWLYADDATNYTVMPPIAFDTYLSSNEVEAGTGISITGSTGTPHGIRISATGVGSGDMAKSVYDQDDDGIVDRAEGGLGTAITWQTACDFNFLTAAYTNGEGMVQSGSDFSHSVGFGWSCGPTPSYNVNGFRWTNAIVSGTVYRLTLTGKRNYAQNAVWRAEPSSNELTFSSFSATTVTVTWAQSAPDSNVLVRYLSGASSYLLGFKLEVATVSVFRTSDSVNPRLPGFQDLGSRTERWGTVWGGTVDVSAVKLPGTNPITAAKMSEWDAAAGSGDMLKSGYDTNDNGVVDDVDLLNGIPAATVTTQAAQGATAYGWGDHAGEGYLTTESDPVAVTDAYIAGQSGTGAVAKTGKVLAITMPSAGSGDMLKSGYDTNDNGVVDDVDLLNDVPAATVTTQAAQGATAYGWGDHALGGYLTSESDAIGIAWGGSGIVAAAAAEANQNAASNSLQGQVDNKAPLVTNPVAGTVQYYNGASWIPFTNMLFLGTNWLFYWNSTNSPARFP